MSKKKSSRTSSRGVCLQNRRARHDYTIIETFEAGMVLTGDEVKSLRLGHGSLQETYAALQGNQIALTGLFLPPYACAASPNKHNPRRPRTLLLHKHEIRKLSGAVNKQGLTLIPTQLYEASNGRLKLELALARGKTKFDKRETLKQRSWQRQKQHLLKKGAYPL